MTKKKINQPTSMPTRKMWAVLVSSAVVAVARYYISEYVPQFDQIEIYALLENLVSVSVIFGAGYFVKDYANESNTDSTGGDSGPGDSTSV